MFGHENHEMQREILRALEKIEHKLNFIIQILSEPDSAKTKITSQIGEIDMAQTTLKAFPGSDVLTFSTFDTSVPPADITSRCTYVVTSDGAAVVVGTVTANTASVTYAVGSANLSVATTDSGGDAIPMDVLAVTIVPEPGITTITAKNATTVIS